MDMNFRLRFMVCGVWCHLQQYFSYIVTVSFIGGGHQSTYRTDTIYHIKLYRTGFEL